MVVEAAAAGVVVVVAAAAVSVAAAGAVALALAQLLNPKANPQPFSRTGGGSEEWGLGRGEQVGQGSSR